MAPRYPSIPEPTLEATSLRDSILSIKQMLEILTGQRGNAAYAAVMPDDLTETITDIDASINNLLTSKVDKDGDTMTDTLLITPPTNSLNLGIDVTQIGSGVGTSTNDFGYAYNHCYILSQKIDVSGQVAPIANGLLVDVYPRTGHKGHAVAIQGAVVIPSSTVINEATDHVGVLGYCNLSAGHGGTDPITDAKGAGFGGHFFVVGNAPNLFGVAGVEINVVTQTGSSMSRRAALSLCSIGSQVQGSQYDVALNISSGAGVGWLNGISFSAFNGSHPMDATNGKLFTTIGAANVHSGIDISSYTYSGSAFKSTGFNVDGTGKVDADSISLDGVLTLSSTAGTTPYVFFKNAAGTNTFISGGGGATPDNTNYFQNNKNVFRTITATDYGTIDATGATLAQSANVPVGGTAGLGLKLSAFANFGVFFGSGVPTLAAAQGSLYLRTDGSSASTRMYVNTNGSTGWTNVVTAT